MGESHQKKSVLSLVVPVYKESACIHPFLQRVRPVLETVRSQYAMEPEILFVLDPSPDDTETVILEARQEYPGIKLLVMSRRFGQQPAILAGLFHATGDAAVILDVDLQDPPELIPEMVARFREDKDDVVYAVRARRHQNEPWVKSQLVHWGYRLMSKISTVDIPADTGDFRLVSRRVIEELRRLREHHAFFRGLVPFVGFRQSGISFDREDRQAGQTKYNVLWGSLSNGINALVCYSNWLLGLAGWLAVFFFFAGFVLTGLLVYAKTFTGLVIPAVPALLAILILWVAAIQSLLLAILGAYIGRIYDETKDRPLFILDRKIGF